MFKKLLRFIKSRLSISVPKADLKEFNTVISRVNLIRAKITALTFIFLQVCLLFATFITKRGEFFKKPTLYYVSMYIALLLAMIVFFIVFKMLQKNISENLKKIYVGGIFFIVSILIYCAGISLLDQLSSGQIIIYIIATIAVASTPIFEPIALLLIFIVIQVLFMIFLPYFQKSYSMLVANYFNSITLIVISWIIAFMRYKKQIDDFYMQKMLESKNEELNKMNIKLEKVNLKLEKLSQTDALTGIYNRLVFDKTLKLEWERCKRHFIPLSLIMVDIDYFKLFNDNYGHLAGDDCIRKIAEVLSSNARRASDTVARYGGEEFVLILPHTGKEDALRLAEQIREKVEGLGIPHEYSNVSHYVTISLGVASLIPSAGMTTDQFILTADNALYAAKRSRNSISVA